MCYELLKSTTIKLIMNLIRKGSGGIKVFGLDNAAHDQEHLHFGTIATSSDGSCYSYDLNAADRFIPDFPKNLLAKGILENKKGLSAKLQSAERDGTSNSTVYSPLLLNSAINVL